MACGSLGTTLLPMSWRVTTGTVVKAAPELLGLFASVVTASLYAEPVWVLTTDAVSSVRPGEEKTNRVGTLSSPPKGTPENAATPLTAVAVA